jgi:hypothetical protein
VWFRKENAELRARVAELEAGGASKAGPAMMKINLQSSLQDSEGMLPPLAPLELPHFDFGIMPKD